MAKKIHRTLNCGGLRASVLAVASCLTLSAISLSAAAAGLGKIVVFSGLGQPLRAEIEVSGSHEELLDMRAQMASKDTFRQAGVNYAGTLENLHFVVGKRGDGKAVIKVSSNAPINDPFVDMLLELNWANGRLVREYTFLLDPPEATAKNAAPAVSNRPLLATSQAHGRTSRVHVEASAPKAEEKSNEKPNEKPDEKADQKSAAKPAAEPASSQPQGKYEVRRGDTLSKIAGANKPEGASLEQMLVALFRANQEAFDGGNMNRLQRGRILAIPESTAVESVTPEEAEKIVKAQSSDWNAYRSRLAALAAKTPVKEGEGKQQASGKITARVEDKAAAPAEARDQVRLSRKDSGDAGQGLAGKPSEEDRVARDKALKEANERLALLEKNVANLQKLLELKSQSLAELQQRVAEKAAPQPKAQADEAKPTPPVAPAAPATPAAEAAKAEPAPTPAAPTATDAKPEEKPAAPAEAAAPTAAAPAAEVADKPASQTEPQPAQTNWVDLLRDNPLAQAGAGLLALLGVFALFRRRRNAQAVTAAPDAPSAPAAEAAESVESVESAEAENPATEPAVDSADSVSSGAPVEAVASPEAERTDAGSPEAGAVAAENPLYGAGEPMSAEAPVVPETANESRPVASASEALPPAASMATAEAAAPERSPVAPVPAPEIPAAPAAPAADPTPATVPATADLTSLDFDLGPEEVKAKAPAPVDAAGEPPANEPGTAPADSNVLDFDLGRAAELEAAPRAPMTGAADSEAADALASGETTSTPNDANAVPASEAEVPRPAGEAEPVPSPASFQPAVSPWPDLDITKASKDELGAAFELPRSADNVLGAPAPAGDDTFDMASINLDLGSPEPASQTPAEPPVGSPDPLAQPSADATPDLAADFEISANEEAATKLDLAKAYEEMGDLEGARELLREVLTEGDAGQRAEAQALLDKIDA